MKLIHGECLEEMDKLIEQGVTVDAIITDPPYGTTACKWDSVIPLEPMWERLNKLIKTNGAVVLFGSEPFSSRVRMSNIKNYKYDWVWDKKKAGNIFLAKNQPMKTFENIMVFSNRKNRYFPIMEKRDKVIKSKNYGTGEGIPVNGKNDGVVYTYTHKYPKAILEISNANQRNRVHPTQKPVPLMEYLVKTYTNEGETVLDFTFGSGTTGIACQNTGRKFVGIEMDDNYFKIAEKRISENE